MNLISKLTINYDLCVDIVNPFFFEIQTETPRVPIFTEPSAVPSSFSRGRRTCNIELSANPENIRIDMKTILDKKELTIFNRNQLITLKDIYHVEWMLSAMTGCMEFKIECAYFNIGGETIEKF